MYTLGLLLYLDAELCAVRSEPVNAGLAKKDLCPVNLHPL